MKSYRYASQYLAKFAAEDKEEQPPALDAYSGIMTGAGAVGGGIGGSRLGSRAVDELLRRVKDPKNLVSAKTQSRITRGVAEKLYKKHYPDKRFAGNLSEQLKRHTKTDLNSLKQKLSQVEDMKKRLEDPKFLAGLTPEDLVVMKPTVEQEVQNASDALKQSTRREFKDVLKARARSARSANRKFNNKLTNTSDRIMRRYVSDKVLPKLRGAGKIVGGTLGALALGSAAYALTSPKTRKAITSIVD